MISNIKNQLLLKRREILINNAAPINVKENQWIRAMKNAIAFGNISIFQRLSQQRLNDPDLMQLDLQNIYQKDFKCPILHTLALNNRGLLLEHFLENKMSNINQTNQKGQTALHIAVIVSLQNQNLDMIKRLQKYGADILIKDRMGKTAFNYAYDEDPKIQKEYTKYISQYYYQKRSQRMKQLFFVLINSGVRYEQPFKYFNEMQLHGILELI